MEKVRREAWDCTCVLVELLLEAAWAEAVRAQDSSHQDVNGR